MAWIEIDKNLVIARATYIEKQITNTISDNDLDPLQDCIDNAVATIRSAISQGGKCKNKGASGTLPKSLVDCALSIIVYHFASRTLNQTVQNQDPRARMYQRALDDLDKLREGKLLVEDDETDEVVNSATTIKTVEARKFRRFPLWGTIKM